MKKGIVLVALGIMLITIVLLIFQIFSPKNQAERAVENFYDYEKSAAYSLSWEMFHPLMQEKLDKKEYLQVRGELFMGYLSTKEFSYSIEKIDKVKGWTMDESSNTFEVVYKVQVNQRLKGDFGNFTIIQHVYAAEVEGDWKILWDYKRN
ncbi:hypothetical protein [Oceanobacillus manasiensis]|uniref:hypothetical protein n=1 Tax=Oceanobacillus manasiensis TaxID=586413 RepID=UPI0005A6EE75|nr:hypothetical protein [Oceanobacillus manasiensis]